MIHVLAVLETMWGNSPGQASRFFKINPKNFSGRRLYSLIGPGNNLLVTNACRELVTSAKHHGKPDPQWLFENLNRLHQRILFDVVLVCGKVAQSTFKQCGFRYPSHVRIIEIPHPAARAVWNKEYIETVKAQIKGITK